MSDLLTNYAKPLTEATITLRIIKSFEFRTERSLVLTNLNLETTSVGQLKEIAKQAILTQPGWKPYKNAVLDTLKLYSKAHGAKTTNLIINLDHDEWILDDDEKMLADLGFGGSQSHRKRNGSELFLQRTIRAIQEEPATLIHFLKTNWDC
ncbi:hypothetical protein C8J56DRAFT_958740 [Mycena floridula]|nr:hypothetical protein C8J56DRAFT_958740 [Mycena floridula]